jgi:hypothetical protein
MHYVVLGREPLGHLSQSFRLRRERWEERRVLDRMVPCTNWQYCPQSVPKRRKFATIVIACGGSSSAFSSVARRCPLDQLARARACYRADGRGFP